jgi:hypothetical protein
LSKSVAFRHRRAGLSLRNPAGTLPLGFSHRRITHDDGEECTKEKDQYCVGGISDPAQRRKYFLPKRTSLFMKYSGNKPYCGAAYRV